jgi:hypothetical protein
VPVDNDTNRTLVIGPQPTKNTTATGNATKNHTTTVYYRINNQIISAVLKKSNMTRCNCFILPHRIVVE